MKMHYLTTDMLDTWNEAAGFINGGERAHWRYHRLDVDQLARECATVTTDDDDDLELEVQ